ncbi:MAG: FAD:protein FMN transferase [Ruminococcaceae bacterium]|nr:FAD:protein FMN transferase [Oscillospiraceae bacterium]
MNKKRVVSLVIVLTVTVLCLGAGLYSYSRAKKFPMSEKNTYAMGTIVSQKVYGDYAAKHIEKGNLLINTLEDTISKNVDSSAVSELNKNGTLTHKDTAELISACEELSEASDGAFDVTVGKVVDLWDFGGDNEGIPEKKALEKALSAVGDIEIDGDTVKIGNNAEVDLGAVGKGLACDSVISLYRATEGIEGAIVSVGGSVGCFGSPNKRGDSWRIAVRHPRSENEFLGVLTLKEGFVSTSGDYEKYFMYDGERYHHILDARTGYPASSGLISVTVICDSGFLSDALSTACFILGREKSLELLEKYNASAIFVDEEMNVTTVGEAEFEKR